VLQHGDRKGPPLPIAPPSPLLYDVGAAKPVYSSGEGGGVGQGGPLRSPCWRRNDHVGLRAQSGDTCPLDRVLCGHAGSFI